MHARDFSAEDQLLASIENDAILVGNQVAPVSLEVFLYPEAQSRPSEPLHAAKTGSNAGKGLLRAHNPL